MINFYAITPINVIDLGVHKDVNEAYQRAIKDYHLHLEPRGFIVADVGQAVYLNARLSAQTK